MVGLWLTTIGMFILLVFSIIFFLFTMKKALHSEDSTRIDPLPKIKQ